MTQKHSQTLLKITKKSQTKRMINLKLRMGLELGTRKNNKTKRLKIDPRTNRSHNKMRSVKKLKTMRKVRMRRRPKRRRNQLLSWQIQTSHGVT